MVVLWLCCAVLCLFVCLSVCLFVLLFVCLVDSGACLTCGARLCAWGCRGGAADMGDKSGAALSTSGMLRLMRELKELRREPPEVLYGLRMNSALGGDMNDEEPNETIGKDGRAQQQKYVERPADAAGSSTDESSSKAAEILFVIRGPDGAYMLFSNDRGHERCAVAHAPKRNGPRLGPVNMRRLHMFFSPSLAL